MPEKMLFFSKIFFVLAWGGHIGVVVYSLFKIVNQQVNWVQNAESLFIVQKRIKQTAFLIFLFLIFISVWDYKINDENCLSCLSRWYKYNAMFEIGFLVAYLIITLMSLIFKTKRYYDKNINIFLKRSIFKTFFSIIIYFFMSKILIPI